MGSQYGSLFIQTMNNLKFIAAWIFEIDSVIRRNRINSEIDMTEFVH
jgi:hypothetical protein